jgi:ubiquinone/menaquinone biosynthesis C-methylase UbiE
MTAFGKIINRLKGNAGQRPTETEPAAAYDLWAATYDEQPANLMLHLEETLFTRLMAQADWRNKTVVDIGCGTGRHWDRILSQHPASLIGYDVSAEMLKRLHQKYPQARTWLLQGHAMKELQAASMDVLVSTLTLAHIEDLTGALREWNRILKPDGEVVLTDYHPAALEKGADRTFRHQGNLIAIKNFIHPIGGLRLLMSQLGWQEMEFMELKIDESVKHYYKRQNALRIYERFYQTPIIYGWRLKKEAGQ